MISHHSFCNKTAEKFGLPLQVLTCYAQMASGQEEDVEAAVKQLLELAGQQRDSVPVLLALASGFMLKKQTPKARWHCFARSMRG